MKLRIVSDLHLDINEDWNVRIPKDGVFTLVAGDLGGDFKNNGKWLKNNLRRGAFISGNHDAYTDEKIPIEDVKDFYRKNFPIGGKISYLDGDVGPISMELDDGVLLIADVLYTDYRLKTTPNMRKMKVSDRISLNMRLASPRIGGMYMNDFNFFTRNGKYRKNLDDLFDSCPKDMFYLRPENYKEHFDRTFRKITKIVEENRDREIILMTHHCLSEKCIFGSYTGNTLNASYVSDKESWIRKHGNIRLVVSGHVHHRTSFKVGNALYVTNPLGYIRNLQFSQKNEDTGKNEYWSPNCFVDTETWTMEYVPHDTKKWEKIMNNPFNDYLW